MAWAKRQKAGSASAKLVLLVLADYADETGRCWPARATIAEECELSPRSVSSQIADLERASLVKRDPRTRANGSQTSNTFQLLMPGTDGGGANGASPPLQDFPPPPADPATPGVQMVQGGGANGASPEPPYKPPVGTSSLRSEVVAPATELVLAGQPRPAKAPRSKKAGPAQPTTEEIAAFERFWSAFPRREKRQPALAAYILAHRERQATHEQLVNGAAGYARSRQGEDHKFTALAASWLNQCRWDDEYPQPLQVIHGTPGTSAGLRDRHQKISRLAVGVSAALGRRRLSDIDH